MRPCGPRRAGQALLPKKLALPIFASDALSSVAYATQEILIVLTVGGTAYLYLAPWVAVAVAVLMGAVVLSYRQLVKAYPTGGGDYEVATKNIGKPAGVVVASALLVDYVMTVAVSVSSGVDNIISAVPSMHAFRVALALIFVFVLAAVNLRGIREAGKAFAVPTYLFAAGVGIMIITGSVPGDHGRRPGGREREVRRRGAARVQLADVLRPGVLHPARVLVRMHRADRGRGHRQRRARVQEAQGDQRPEDAGPDGLDRGVDVRRHHGAGPRSPRSTSPTPPRAAAT